MFLDKDVRADPGLPLRGGNNRISIVVKDGLVDLCPLHSCIEPIAQALVESIGRLDDYSKVPMVELTHRLDKAGRSALWFWRQMIWYIGGMLDDGLIHSSANLREEAAACEDAEANTEVSVESLLAPRGQAARDKRRRKHAEKFKVAKWQEAALTIYPLKVFFATRFVYQLRAYGCICRLQPRWRFEPHDVLHHAAHWCRGMASTLGEPLLGASVSVTHTQRNVRLG